MTSNPEQELTKAIRQLTNAVTTNASIDQKAAIYERAKKTLDDLGASIKPTELKTFAEPAQGIVDRMKWGEQNVGKFPGILTGFRGVDFATTGLNDGKLLGILGDTGSGKSTFASAIAMNQIRNGIPGLIVPTELGTEGWSRRIVAQITGITHTSLALGYHFGYDERVHDFTSRAFTLDDKKKILQALTWLVQTGTRFSDSSSPNMVEYINNVYRAIEETKIQYILIDSISVMRPTAHPNQAVAIDTMIDEIMRLALETKIPVIVTSQVSRNVKDRKNKVPNKWDAQYSHKFEQNVNTLLAVYNHWAYVKAGLAEDDGIHKQGHSYAYVLKARDNDDTLGRAVEMKFDGATLIQVERK